jgi:ABC-type amino acid transport substrate-binding protein
LDGKSQRRTRLYPIFFSEEKKVKKFPIFTLVALMIMSILLVACQPGAEQAAISGRDDLVGKKIGAQLGTTGAIEAEKIENAEVKTYDSYDLAFLDLANGQIDAVIADYPTALGFVERNSDKLMVVGEVFTDESYGIAVCKNNPELLDQINAGLAAVKANETAAKLEEKWLAEASAAGTFSVPKVEGTISGPAIRVATDATFPPFEIVDESTQELTGFDIELMRAIAAESNLNIEFVNIAFDSVVAGLAQCQYEAAIAAITITEERAEQMLFSDPYINAGQIVVIRKTQ